MHLKLTNQLRLQIQSSGGELNKTQMSYSREWLAPFSMWFLSPLRLFSPLLFYLILYKNMIPLRRGISKGEPLHAGIGKGEPWNRARNSTL